MGEIIVVFLDTYCLPQAGQPPAIQVPFHHSLPILLGDMHRTVCFSDGSFEIFSVRSGLKQGCILTPTLFGIFFLILLQYAFANCKESIFIRTTADG